MKTNIRIMLQRRSFWFSFALMLAASIGSYLYSIIQYSGGNIDHAPDSASQYFLQLGLTSIPIVIIYVSLFLIVLPYANSYVLDRKNNTHLLYLSKERNWYVKQLAVAMFGAFVILFIPAICNVIWNSITFYVNGNLNAIGMQGRYIDDFVGDITGDDDFHPTLRKAFYLRGLVYFYPNLYNAVYALLYAVSGAILAGFAYAVSLYLGKIKVMVYTVPFVLIYFLGSFDAFMFSKMKYYVCMEYTYYVSPYYMRLGCFYPAFWALHAVLLVLSIVLSYIKGKSDEL